MSDFISILREREVPDWLRAAYGLVFLIALAHAVVTKDALTCCPPGYTDADILTFVHCVQSAVGWTLVVIAIVEVTTVMVFMVPKVYYGIKEKGERDGIVKGREEGRKEGKAEGIAEGVEKGKVEGKAEGIAEGRVEGRAEGKAEGKAEGERAERERTLDAMREAGVDDETRRRVEDAIFRRARRNGS